MKCIGIDYGAKRVGIAVSDESGSAAFPKATVPNDRTLVPFLKDFIEKEGAEVLVIGESVGPRGDNPIMHDIRRFAGELERETGLPVHFEQEFNSSQEARQTTDERNVDAKAAAIILNSYLNRTKPYDDNA